MAQNDRRARPDPTASADENDPRFLPLEIRPPSSDAKCVESSLSSLSDDITPTRRFFIRSHFPVPTIDPAAWSLEIDGEVDHPLHLSLSDLQHMPHHEVVSVMECAGNSRSSVRPRPEGVLWGHGAVSAARWRGIRLREVLENVGVRPSALEVLFEGADRGNEPGGPGSINYGMSISLAKALHPDTLLVDEMNGAPLEPSHGFPVRAIVPGWYGMASVKWLTRISLLDHAYQGYFRTRAYSYIPEGSPAEAPKVPVTSLRVKSLVTWPREGQVIAPGPHWVRGIAWSGDAPILRVDVSTSPLSGQSEVWRPARLFPTPFRHSWTHWEFPCDLRRPGFYVIRARATDENGNAQPVQADWNFRGVGNNSIHEVPVEVRLDGPPDSA
jgi:DMSO/TMAO reductase YedYZ molybdopterin-dependent catalytic subunit